MNYGINAKGLDNSIEYLQKELINKRVGDVTHISIDLLRCCKRKETNNQKLKMLNSVLATCKVIAEKADKIIKAGEIPLFIGGDHSASIGSVSASSNNYDDLGLLWIDAHPDINTDDTTITGNIHGMSVASLLGLGSASLTKILNDINKIKPKNIVMLGLRAIDPPEKALLDELKIKYYTRSDIKKIGIHNLLVKIEKYLDNKKIHVSIDIDVMNPKIIPGVSVPVEDGLEISEMNYTISFVKARMKVIAWDIVEFNHYYDIEDKTAKYILYMIDSICERNTLLV